MAYEAFLRQERTELELSDDRYAGGYGKPHQWSSVRSHRG